VSRRSEVGYQLPVGCWVLGDYSLRSWWQGGGVLGGSNFLNFLNFRGIKNGRKFAVSPSLVLTDFSTHGLTD
jgi:hypothetical protein